MKRSHFSPCISKPGYGLVQVITSYSRTSLTLHLMQTTKPVLRKDWGLPHGR